MLVRAPTAPPPERMSKFLAVFVTLIALTALGVSGFAAPAWDFFPAEGVGLGMNSSSTASSPSS